MPKYKFAVGIMQDRTVTVRANTEAEARSKAKVLLENRTDPGMWPVAWDLTLLKVSK